MPPWLSAKTVPDNTILPWAAGVQKTVLLFLLLFSISYANVLQDSIDKAAPGSILTLSAGIYTGNIVIDKPLSIIAKESGVIIQGDHTGKVVTINSSDVVLKNLTISGSGSRMENIDSAITINKARRCTISGCRIIDSLYGIDMVMVENSVIKDNYITSNTDDIGLRGDALKIWYSNNNIIKHNTIETSRDVTLTRSNDNIIKGNRFRNNRFALHLELSRGNTVEDNVYRYNSVAILLTGAKDTNITGNTIESSRGAAGIGVVMAGTSNLVFQNNRVRFNAKGIFIDTKFTEERMQRYITGNEISYNAEAIHFHAAIQNNTIRNNRFFGNIDDIVKNSRKNVTEKNIIERNYWDRYAGFDSNRDNIGDTPHKILQYSDRLWQYNNKVKFFYASPVLSLLDFLASIAPFVEPVLIIEDTKPVFRD